MGNTLAKIWEVCKCTSGVCLRNIAEEEKEKERMTTEILAKGNYSNPQKKTAVIGEKNVNYFCGNQAYN
jgi:hypothetical protein